MQYQDIKQFLFDLQELLNIDSKGIILIFIIICLVYFIIKNRNLFFKTCRENQKVRSRLYTKSRILIKKYMKSLFTENEPIFGDEYTDLVSELELHFDPFIAENFKQLTNYIYQVGEIHAGNQDNPEAIELANKLNEYSDLVFKVMLKNKPLYRKKFLKVCKSINDILYNW